MIILTIYYTIALLVISILSLYLLALQKKANSITGKTQEIESGYINKTGHTSSAVQSLDDIRSALLTLPRINKQDWSQLEIDINNILDNFTIKLRKDFPDLTKDDVQIILLIRTGMNHEEIAHICGILQSSFRKRRSRLKKKMNVECNSISEFIKNMYPSLHSNKPK